MAGVVDELVRRLMAQACTLWPEAPPLEISLAATSTRPYSTVFRLRLDDGARVGQRAGAVYAKVFKISAAHPHDRQKYLDRLQTEFDTAYRLRAQIGPQAEFAVVRPLAYYPDLLALVTEEAEGQVLSRLIATSCRRWQGPGAWRKILHYCRQAGMALAAMQGATREKDPLDCGELLAYIELRLRRLRDHAAVPFSGQDYQLVYDYLQRVLEAVPPAQLEQCGCHCDYGPFNLLAADSGVTVFDFSMFKIGSCYNDVAYFVHRLEGFLHKPIYSRRAVHAAQEAFLLAYDQARGRAGRPVQNDLLFRVFWLKHVINNYSAIMRQRVAGAGRRLSLPVRLFNHHVYRRYNAWLLDLCR